MTHDSFWDDICQSARGLPMSELTLDEISKKIKVDPTIILKKTGLCRDSFHVVLGKRIKSQEGFRRRVIDEGVRSEDLKRLREAAFASASMSGLTNLRTSKVAVAASVPFMTAKRYFNGDLKTGLQKLACEEARLKKNYKIIAQAVAAGVPLGFALTEEERAQTSQAIFNI